MSRVDDLYQEHYDAVRDPHKAYMEMRDLARELENEGVVQVYAARKLAMVYVGSNESYERQIQDLKDLLNRCYSQAKAGYDENRDEVVYWIEELEDKIEEAIK